MDSGDNVRPAGHSEVAPLKYWLSMFLDVPLFYRLSKPIKMFIVLTFVLNQNEYYYINR